mmetsp:Transcript_42785/g.47833  ORF Transcript_42785/g.47833 Transcript_42785/m.47833 type:complete len:105 (+) Transcript_42785:346-660(+)
MMKINTGFTYIHFGSLLVGHLLSSPEPLSSSSSSDWKLKSHTMTLPANVLELEHVSAYHMMSHQRSYHGWWNVILPRDIVRSSSERDAMPTMTTNRWPFCYSTG